MQLLLICIYVCVCLWCGNVYAVCVLFMHEDAPVGRQTTNIFDDNTRKDDFRQDLRFEINGDYIQRRFFELRFLA